MIILGTSCFHVWRCQFWCIVTELVVWTSLTLGDLCLHTHYSHHIPCTPSSAHHLTHMCGWEGHSPIMDSWNHPKLFCGELFYSWKLADTKITLNMVSNDNWRAQSQSGLAHKLIKPLDMKVFSNINVFGLVEMFMAFCAIWTIPSIIILLGLPTHSHPFNCDFMFTVYVSEYVINIIIYTSCDQTLFHWTSDVCRLVTVFVCLLICSSPCVGALINQTWWFWRHDNQETTSGRETRRATTTGTGTSNV